MLETIREFAAARLEETELEPLRDRYVQWFARMATEAGLQLGERNAVEWLKRLDADVGNLRMAFTFAVERGDDDAVALGTTLGEFHSLRGRFAEALDTLTATLVLAHTPLELAKIHHRIGTALVRRTELSAAAASYAKADDLLGAPSNGDPAWWRAWLDLRLEAALVHYWAADVPALHAALDELEPHIEWHGTARQRASFLSSQVVEALRRERYVASEETEQLARASCEAAEAAGDWDGHFQLGFVLLWRDKFDEARSHLRLGRDDAKAAGDALTEIRCLIYEAIAERRLGEVLAVRTLDGEIEGLEDMYAYRSLIAANRAWLAWRDGDLDSTETLGAIAVADWKSESRSGATVYQWSARFPLLAVDVERGRLESAAAHAHAMLDASQHPLRTDVREAVEEVLRNGSRATFQHAIDVARRYGYT